MLNYCLTFVYVDDNTKSKFLLFGGNDYQEEGGLVDYIPQEYFPDFLGGPCKVQYFFLVNHFKI